MRRKARRKGWTELFRPGPEEVRPEPDEEGDLGLALAAK